MMCGVISGVLYWRHTKRTAFPLLDPMLLVRHQQFRSAIIGGSIFRVGVGATPFLLPLMLQLAFGMTPFESGMITFIGALGAILSKFVAERAFAAFGFPRVLVFTSIGACLSLSFNGFFTPETPHIILYGVLLAMGLMRSTFFTGVNALGFSDVEEHEASQASAITAVSQQLSIAFGVAVAGGALEVSAGMMGGKLSLEAFHAAWFAVAGISLLSALLFWRLPADAASDVSGHKILKPPPKPPDTVL
ncbi:MAG: MFS transporter [Hyphomicrobiales bacterium]|nr:MAG: MFS transporter [Hyphomicrobiales bacterium]